MEDNKITICTCGAWNFDQVCWYCYKPLKEIRGVIK